MNDIKLAGELRPGHIVSLTGLEPDAAEITKIQASQDYSEITITVETGEKQSFSITTPIVIYPE